MKKRDHIEYWVKSADSDLEAAEALFESAKYDWCLFIAHLVLGKALKANFVLTNESKNPPRIHNLVKLAELSFLNLSDAEILFLDEINDFNIAA
ncbi:MAG: HEPN domain-containing protein [Deltaproteobacteria bacterium]|nr:HEPN domain-containing protein [Deltaproteobacteria bacterium]